MSLICHLTDSENVEGFLITLSEDSLNFHLSSSKPEDAYDIVIGIFRENYLTVEQRYRILISWQGIRLSAEMRENTQKSELEVFRSMVTKLLKLQRQLSTICHQDAFLRDQIVISFDTPSIQQSMRERVPETSAKGTNRTATFLSSESGSAVAFVTSHEAL